MFSRLFCVVAFFGFLVPVAMVNAKDEPTSVSVGAAKIDITPAYPVRMSGYGNRRNEFEGVAQKLWAKAIAIGDDKGDGPAIWIVYENCGLTPAIRKEVARVLDERFHVRSERLVISVTHSHTAPCLTDWAPYIFGSDLPAEHQQHVDQYTREMTAKLVQVAGEAIAARRPARLSWAQGKASFAANRRVLKDGKWTGFGVQPDGPVDHSLPILVAKNDQGKPIACVANYACHCTTLGGNFNRICGDWAGYAAEYIEQDHPGCVALITIGCGADANPEPRRDELELCQQHGRQLADEVKRLIAGEMKGLSSELQCRLTHVDLPFEAPRTADEWRERAKRTDAIGYHAKKFLARMERSKQNPDGLIPTSLTYPIATWNFGRDLALVFLGGEVVVDYAVRMKSEFDPERLWITAYSNDVPCYIPSRRILAEGGYEADQSLAYYARPQKLSGEVEDLIVDTVQKLLPNWFYGPPKQVDFPPPKSPEESLAAIKLHPGLKVELVAAEPLVEDPVAFDWTPDGRMWVAEMRDYPNGMQWNGPGDHMGDPGGRVKLLTDVDGDGRYDRASVFLDKIPFPNGVKTWRNGVLVTAAPTIFYAEDTDNDGVADKRETLFEGFVEGNQQHRANGLRWGIDNWLYVANGDSGGKIKSLKTGEVLSISGRDLRIRPDDGAMEAQSGGTQYGRCCDDWGNWFGGNNANPLWHYVLDDHYLRRNPHFAPPSVHRDVPEVSGAAPIFPASRTLTRFNDFHTANRFTSACSPEIYRDELLNSVLGQDGMQVFICEPVHNLVHREVMHEDGVSFRSQRAADEQQSEFFASADNWSRPVMIRTGPDGALWIADMYRQVIEHPQWIPSSWQRKLDLRAGSDRGRIYRVSLADEKRKPFPTLRQQDTPGLVVALHSSNGWVRDTAQQMLIWGKDEKARPHLEELVSSAARPTTRLHTLATLDGMGSLDPESCAKALGDQHPGVRRHAIRLAERVLGHSIELLAEDKNDLVRQQVAYSLGEMGLAYGSVNWGTFLAEIAIRDAKNPSITAAALSSVNEDNIAGFITALSAAKDPPTELIRSALATIPDLKDKQKAKNLVRSILNQGAERPLPIRFKISADVLEVFSRRPESRELLLDDGVVKRFSDLAIEARRVAGDDSSPVSNRIVAIRLLGLNPQPDSGHAEPLMAFLVPQNPPELQAAVIAALAERMQPGDAQKLLANWRLFSPVLRAQILDTLFTRPALTTEFLAAVERGDVQKAHIDARRRQQLLRSSNGSIRDLAAKLFAGETSSNRAEVLEQFRIVATMTGDVPRGKAVFSKKCATCHKLEDVGQNVGPELTALTDKSPASMLVAILDPNKAVEDKFLDYVAVTTDGRQITGMMFNETSNGVTLVGQEGKQIALRRNELDSLQSSGKSMMPEGLEKDLTKQDIADVIAYVRGISLPPKQFPGNVPELAHIRDDGSIRMLAMNAKIYGPKLVLEEKYRNLGYWQSPDDYAVWTMNVPKAGKYRVGVEYACADDSAGDRFVMIIGNQTVGGVVEGTGSWDKYRSQTVGSVVLAAGLTDLTMRSDGPIRSAMMDLRQIVLYPE